MRKPGLRVKGNDPSIWEILKAIIYCSPAALTYVYVTVSALNSSDKVIIGSSLMTLSGGLVNVRCLLRVKTNTFNSCFNLITDHGQNLHITIWW